MKLYTPEGWLDVPAIMDSGYPFIFVCGGRGTGKTYGALQEVRRRSAPQQRFMFLRRTQAQIDILNKPEFSPFKAIDRDNGYITLVKPISQYSSGFYNATETDDGKPVATGAPLGYTAALSTFSNLRGVDMSDVQWCILDEFIPQAQERPLKHEDQAILNCYETINRNRELQGRQALQLLCLANANTLGNPMFLSLGLVRQAERMQLKGREIWTDDKRGILLVMLQRSPISEAKRDTALYRLQQDTEYSRMALNNEFSGEERGSSKAVPLKELVPIVAVGEICIYRNKAGGLYVSGHKSGSPDTFGTGPNELRRFRTKYPWIWYQYLNRKVIFDEYVNEILLRQYYNK